MPDDERTSDTRPLGKSVEEVEADNQNAVNSPVDSEDRRREDNAVPAVIPAYNQGGGTGGVFGVVANPDVLVGDRGEDADDGVNDKDLDDTPQ